MLDLRAVELDRAAFDRSSDGPEGYLELEHLDFPGGQPGGMGRWNRRRCGRLCWPFRRMIEGLLGVTVRTQTLKRRKTFATIGGTGVLASRTPDTTAPVNLRFGRQGSKR